MLLTVGRIIRAHGVRGEVLVEVLTDEPERRYGVGVTLIATPAAAARASARATAGDSGARAPGGPPASLTIEELRPHQGRFIVTFDGVPDRSAAEQLRGLLLQVDSETVAPPADPDEFHDHQLVGLAVVTPQGEPIGEVDRIEHAPSSDLLVLRRPDGRTVLVPFVKALVPEVDLPGGRVIVDPPVGLLDLNV